MIRFLKKQWQKFLDWEFDYEWTIRFTLSIEQIILIIGALILLIWSVI